MILWQNNTLAKWYFGKMIFGQSNTLAKWYLGIHTGRFPNKHTVQSKRFCKLVHEMTANWMAEEPPIQRSMIFTGKRAARTSWSKRTPRSPNYVLLSLVLIYWYNCAVLFAAPRVVQEWVRLGYVLSSRVPGRRDAAVHGHALKSCAAHAGFPCKDRSAKLEFEFFGHENHVSWSFYRFMLRDKRHYSQVLRFEAGSTNCKQAQLSQLLHRHTVPTAKKTYRWHLFD